MIMHKKGFTYIELIIAATILALVVAGVYAAFLAAVQFIAFFRHDIMAVVGTDGWLSKLYGANSFGNLGNTGGFQNIPDPDPGTPQNEDLHLYWGQLEGEVDNTTYLTDVDPPDYSITENVNLGCNNPAYDFTRMDIRVEWDERQM